MGSLGEDLSLAPTFNHKEIPKAFCLPSRSRSRRRWRLHYSTDWPKISPEVPRTVGYKTHQGIRRSLSQNPAMRRKARRCSFQTHRRGGRKQGQISLVRAWNELQPEARRSSPVFFPLSGESENYTFVLFFSLQDFG